MGKRLPIRSQRTGIVVDNDGEGGIVRDDLFGFLWRYETSRYPLRNGMRVVFQPRSRKGQWRLALSVQPATVAFRELQNQQRATRLMRDDADDELTTSYRRAA